MLTLRVDIKIENNAIVDEIVQTIGRIEGVEKISSVQRIEVQPDVQPKGEYDFMQGVPRTHEELIAAANKAMASYTWGKKSAERSEQCEKEGLMTIVWRPEARRIMRNIYKFYAKNFPDKADELMQKIVDAIEQLARFPRMAPVAGELADCYREYRSLVVNTYYRVIYCLDYSACTAVIAAIGSHRSKSIGAEPYNASWMPDEI